MFRNRRKVLKAGSFHLWWCCLRYLLRFAVFCHHLVSQVFLWNQNAHDELLELLDLYQEIQCLPLLPQGKRRNRKLLLIFLESRFYFSLTLEFLVRVIFIQIIFVASNYWWIGSVANEKQSRKVLKHVFIRDINLVPQLRNEFGKYYWRRVRLICHLEYLKLEAVFSVVGESWHNFCISLPLRSEFLNE